MRLMRHGLVGRLPRPANGDHARGAATMLQSAVVPTAAAPQSETMFVHSERWHNDQLGRSENFRSFRCVFRLLRAMCVDGTISIALVAQIVKTVQLTPADFHASTQTRHQNTAIRVEHRFEQRHHRYFTAHRAKAATVDRGRISDASNACSASSVPLRDAGRRTSAFVVQSQPRATAVSARVVAHTCPYRSLYHGSIAWETEHGVWVGHNGRVTILQSLSDMMRRPGNNSFEMPEFIQSHSMRVPVSLRPLTGADYDEWNEVRWRNDAWLKRGNPATRCTAPPSPTRNG